MKLLTWNMQGSGGWSAVIPLMETYDVACLQEVGGPPEMTNVVEYPSGIITGEITRGTTRTGKTTIFVTYYAWGEGNDRCSLAVLNLWAAEWIMVSITTDDLRPIIGIDLGTSDYLFSIHAPSSNDGFASSTATTLLNGITAARKWIVAGDYNCPPKAMRDRGWDVTSGTQVTQQGGRVLDYAIADDWPITYIEPEGKAVSDHYGQAFEIGEP